jgi:hypothetical protein
MAWLTGYTTRRKLTINYSKVDSALSDFPVLVKLTSTNFNFSKANSDGFDIRFTSSDGTTLLKYERERHDSTNSLAEYWVKVPSVSSTSNTDIYIYYRTTDTADGADPTNVWDSSFGLVYHMKNATTTTVADSTTNGFTGTKTDANGPLEENSMIAKGQVFDGTNDEIDTVDDPFAAADFTTNGATLECFFKTPGSESPDRYIVSLEGYLTIGTTYADGKIRATTDGGVNFLFSTASRSDNVWHHAAIVWDPNGTPTAYLYINGSQEATHAAGGPALSTTRPFAVGEHSAGAHFFVGSVDEVRISKTARSAAWVKATNSTGRNTLLTYGSEETPGINTKINISDVWKDASEMKINIGDAWKDVTEVKINIGDSWKTVF